MIFKKIVTKLVFLTESKDMIKYLTPIFQFLMFKLIHLLKKQESKMDNILSVVFSIPIVLLMLLWKDFMNDILTKKSKTKVFTSFYTILPQIVF